MNTIFKLYRNNFFNKAVLYKLIYPKSIISSSKQHFKLCYLNKVKTKKENFTFKLYLSISILTWLGFNKDDEEKESELIMTIKRAILLTQREEYTKAEQMLHLALRLSQDQQNPQGILYVYDLMANLALEREEFDKAKKLFVNVLQRLIAEGLAEDDLKVIHISLKLARIYHMKGEEQNAETGFKWCLDNIEKRLLNNKNDNDVKALNGIIRDWYGKFLLEKGQVNEALTHFKIAYEICTEIEGTDSIKLILLLNDLGTVYWRLGDLKSAKDYLLRAVQISKNMDEFDYLGVIYANLGLVCLENGILTEANKYCKEGWRLGKKQQSTDAIDQANYCFEQIRSYA